ncbi:MAG TPA: DUF4142 domain-containing protein [Oscillatoriaceae cyanobacterium]
MLKRGMAFLVVSALLTAAPAMAWTHSKGGGGGTTTTTTTKTHVRGGGAGSTMTTNTTKTKSTLSTADRQFVEKAAAGDRTEIALGNFAMQHAQSPTTKQVADRIVKDHTKDLQTVTAMAKKLGVTLPTSEPAEVASTEKQLSSKTGLDFDVAYLNMMVKEHTKDIAAFERASKLASNPAVKAYANAAVPTLKSHLALSEKARRKV